MTFPATRTLSPKIGCTALLAALLTAPQSALAGDPAAADVLFKQAKALAGEGKYAEACPKFEASYNLDKTVGTLMNVADCHENIGRIASAWSEWNTAFEMLKRDGDKRESFALGRRETLAPRLPYLRIDVKGTAENIDIFRGETRLESGAYNIALPVDPGLIVVVARRGDLVLKEERALAEEGKTKVITLDLAAIAAAAPKPPPHAQEGTQPSSPSIMRPTGFVLAGAGGLALLIAGGLELSALTKRDEALNSGQCVGSYCSTKGFELIESARSFASAGQWLGIGGILVGGIGLSIVLLAPSSESAPEKAAHKKTSPGILSAHVEPSISNSLTGISIKGELW